MGQALVKVEGRQNDLSVERTSVEGQATLEPRSTADLEEGLRQSQDLAARRRAWAQFQKLPQPARWDRATKKEKDLLKAMSIDGDGPSSLQSLVERMGRTKSSSLSVTRKGLIDKGIVYSPAHGQLAFTVPGMTDFIRRNSER